MIRFKTGLAATAASMLTISIITLSLLNPQPASPPFPSMPPLFQSLLSTLSSSPVQVALTEPEKAGDDNTIYIYEITGIDYYNQTLSVTFEVEFCEDCCPNYSGNPDKRYVEVTISEPSIGTIPSKWVCIPSDCPLGETVSHTFTFNNVYLPFGATVAVTGDAYCDWCIGQKHFVDSDTYVVRAFPLQPIPEKMGLEPYWTYHSEKLANGQASTNLETGNLVYQVQDVGLPAQGLDIDVIRTYNSQNKVPGLLGLGWNLNIPFLYEDRSTGDAILLDEDQTKHTFTPIAGSSPQSYNSPPGIRSHLIKTDEGFVLTDSDQTKSTFDPASGFIENITDPNNCDLSFDFETMPLKITDESGRLTYMYFENGRLTRLVDPAQREVSYVYDASARLTEVKDTNGNAIQYTYDSDHNLIAVTVIDPTGSKTANLTYASVRLTALSTPLGFPTSFTYNTLSTQVTDPLGAKTTYDYNSWGNPVKTTDATGNVTTYAYDANKILEKKDPRDVKTKYTYDDRANLTSEIVYSSAGAALSTSTYSYDLKNNLTSETNPNGQTTTYTYDEFGDVLSETTRLSPTQTVSSSYTYDAKGNQISETDPNGHTTQYGYNQYGYETSVQDPGSYVSTSGYDAAGNVISETDPNNAVTSYSYDRQGNLLATTDALNQTTTYSYDTLGNKLSEKLPNNAQTTFTYDADGRLTRTASPAGTTKYEYDAASNLKTTIDGNGHATSYSYDSLNRLASVAEPTGGRTFYGYDSVGNRTQMTIPNGGVYSYSYNELSQMTAQVDPEQNKTEYAYDAMGNKLAEKNPEGNQTSYTYDSLNRLTCVTDPYGKTISYGYDKVGNLTSQTDALGNTTKYEYDTNDNLTREIDPLGKTITYTYDGAGNLLSKNDCSGPTRYSYDALNRQTGVIYPDGSTVSYTYDEVGNRTSMTDSSGTTTYAYDLAGRLTSSTDPQNVVTTYEYDSAGNVIKKIVGGKVYLFSYDASNRLTSQTDPYGNTTYYTYDLCGNVTERKYPNQIVTAYMYDKANRLTALSLKNGLGETLVCYTYEYDKNGNRTKIVDSTTGTYEYQYDSKDQLVYIMEPIKGFANPEQTAYERLIEYTYDDNGNRLSKKLSVFFQGHRDRGKHLGINAIIEAVITQGNLKGNKKGIERNIIEILNNIVNDEPMVHGEKVGLMRLVLQVIDGCTFENESGNEYEYNAANQLVKYFDPVAENWITFEYDGNGNLVKESRGTEVTNYSWDAENRLTGISKPDGTTIGYKYNAEGKRVSKEVSTVHGPQSTVHYTYDGWKVTKEVNSGQGTVNSEIQYNYYNEDTPISINYAGQTYFYLTNGHGDITAMTDSSGTVVARYAYDTWGRPIDTWTDETTVAAELLSANPYQYASYRFDDETGFYYLRNRYYDPRTGRFISKDKFAGTMTEPATQNRYVYCGNNPVTKSDPSGLWDWYVHFYLTGSWAYEIATHEYSIPGFRASAVSSLIASSDWSVDRLHRRERKYHFKRKYKANRTAYRYLSRAIRTDNYVSSYDYIGRALHAIQDTVAHDNYKPDEHADWMDDWGNDSNRRGETEDLSKNFLRLFIYRVSSRFLF